MKKGRERGQHIESGCPAVQIRQINMRKISTTLQHSIQMFTSIQHLGFLFSIKATVTVIVDGTDAVGSFVMHSSFFP